MNLLRNIHTPNPFEYITFPRNWSSHASVMFVITLLCCCLIYSNHIWPFFLWIYAFISVFGFFIGGSYLTRSWGKVRRDKEFIRNVFVVAMIIRAALAVFTEYFYTFRYGIYYGPGSTDVMVYVDYALELVSDLTNGINPITQLMNGGMELSDTGYIVYLSIVYFLSGSVSEHILPLLLKSIWGAWTCVLIYKIAKNHFTEDVARMAAIFCVLCPNMIWWCASLMKETEMVFLTALFVQQSDQLLLDRTWSVKRILPIVLSGLFLFTFRTVLGMTAFLALFGALVFSSQSVVGWGKRILLALIILVVVGLSAGNSIYEQIHDVTSTDVRSVQQQNMEWRAKREHANSYAKYAGAAVFAPMIFAIPFPTLSYTYMDQELIMQNAGGNYVKNITSLFVIIALFYLLFSGKWRHHVLIIAILVGYLAVLVMSTYAQSGRFHMPIVPFEMLFAAYGVSLLKANKRYHYFFTLFLGFELIVCIAWQYFKLKGQGLL